MARRGHVFAVVAFVSYALLAAASTTVEAFAASGWSKGTATFYGGSDASGTMAGVGADPACTGAASCRWRSAACPCRRRGGVRFTVAGRDYFELVLVTNVAAAGSVRSMEVRGSRRGAGWMAMSRNWGANWQSLAYLDGQGLSFRVTATDGQTIVFAGVVPPSWRFGQTFASTQQFM
ncbi:hypothetical protein OsJ_22684 [Oryza sativa Japonica Group]|uniref:Expansin n=1 Tax=Oryza sativa subsp. japonica TaxID=39947 RepID=B9FQX8_ORYSJ|nr:hypothetical protein OsJ_22684 [Oryza sativa Japonica Group]